MRTRCRPGVDDTVMLQCVLTKKAQEAYSALPVTDSLNNASVDSAVLFVLMPVLVLVQFRMCTQASLTCATPAQPIALQATTGYRT